MFVILHGTATYITVNKPAELLDCGLSLLKNQGLVRGAVQLGRKVNEISVPGRKVARDYRAFSRISATKIRGFFVRICVMRVFSQSQHFALL